MSTSKENGWKTHAKNVQIDGLTHILRAEYLAAKLVWLLVLATCASACIFLIVSSINDYLSYNVITTNRYFRENSPVFPTVTICQMNTFSTEYALTLVSAANLSGTSDIEAYMKNTTGSYLSDEQKQRMSDFDKILISC